MVLPVRVRFYGDAQMSYKKSYYLFLRDTRKETWSAVCIFPNRERAELILTRLLVRLGGEYTPNNLQIWSAADVAANMGPNYKV
jgi:hypothetical protein